MSVILAFTVIVILPVFSDVYTLAGGSFSSVGISAFIGWIALIVMIVCAVLALALAFSTNTESGRQKVMDMLAHVPRTRQAMYQLALSRFTAALATLVSSGITEEEAMSRAIETVDHDRLRKRLEKAAATMTDLDNPRSLTQAISEKNIFEPRAMRTRPSRSFPTRSSTTPSCKSTARSTASSRCSRRSSRSRSVRRSWRSCSRSSAS